MQQKKFRVVLLVWFVLLILGNVWIYNQSHIGINIALGIMFLCIWGATIFFSPPQKRITTLLWQIVFGSAIFFLSQIGISSGYIILSVLLLGVVWLVLSCFALRRFTNKINHAAKVYQQDHDGDRYLSVLSNSRTSWGGLLFTLGEMPATDVLELLKAQTLREMGRQEACLALLETLKTKSSNTQIQNLCNEEMKKCDMTPER